MKKTTFLFALLILGSMAFAQTWHWINPTTGLQRINDISFVSPDKGIAVGDHGAILHYQNGEWTIAESPVNTNLNAVEFVNPDLAWAVGNEGVILRYNGNNWVQALSPTNGTLKDICCVDENNCWAVGSAIISYNGTSWQPGTDAMDLNTVGFLSANKGWAGSTHTNFFQYISEGWVWDETFASGNPLVFNTIEKAGEGRLLLNGQNIEGEGVLYENTGQGWQAVDAGGVNAGISFYDATHGFGIQHAGPMSFDLLPTIKHFNTDAWSTEYTFEKPDHLFSSIEAIASDEAMAGDVLGYIHHGSGGNWGLGNGFMCDSILDVDFVAANKGFLAADNSGIWKYDAGDWTNIFDIPDYTFNKIDFHADYWGLAAAYTTHDEFPPPYNTEAKLFHFYQGVFSEISVPWAGLTAPISSINDFSYELIISSYNVIYTKTENNWTIETMVATDSISQIRFQEPIPIENHSRGGDWEAGWLCAKRMVTEAGGVIYYKDYLNTEWQQVYLTFSGSFNDLCIPDYGMVYAVGTNGLIAFFDGTNWTETAPLTSENLVSVYVNKDLNGWAVGKNGTILQCSGGVWSVYDSPARFNLNKISFFKDDLGFIVGDQGTFLSTKAKLPVGVFTKPLEAKTDQLHIYPNPAGSYFFIDVVHPDSQLLVSITDMTGRILHEQSFKFSGNKKETARINSAKLSTGMYLVKVNNGEKVITGKLLVK